MGQHIRWLMYYIDPTLYQNKYRLKSCRLRGWDYGRNGWYFVTICTKDWVNYFGMVKSGQAILLRIGTIAQRCWLDIPNHFKGVVLDYFIVMPNHIHGIVVINNKKSGNYDIHNARRRDEACLVSTTTLNDHASRISLKPESLPIIIGSYKSACTKIINTKYPRLSFKWQPRFYDHIITNAQDLYRVREYIRDNPLGWERGGNNI